MVGLGRFLVLPEGKTACFCACRSGLVEVSGWGRGEKSGRWFYESGEIAGGGGKTFASYVYRNR